VRYADEAGVVMTFLRPGPADPLGLAEAVAKVHAARGQRYGWDDAVFLGRFALPTAAEDSRWPDFWAESRVRPLLDVTRSTLGRLAQRVEVLLTQYEPPTEGPTLIHGDLWGGNVVMSDAGATLIDPSVWYGERGVDLAMMRLFGGFDGRFWAAYGDRLPIPPEVEAAIPFYQLYYLLVHVHFFGAGYCRGVEDVLRRYGC
jgi:phosphatidylserine decarboxylase